MGLNRILELDSGWNLARLAWSPEPGGGPGSNLLFRVDSGGPISMAIRFDPDG
jgi:hypothetical protein